MKRISKALALVLLVALGCAVGADGRSQKQPKPAGTTTTAAATTAAATTAATTTTDAVTTTAAATTTDSTTTGTTTDDTTTTATTPPPASGSVHIISPLRNSAYAVNYGNVILNAEVQGPVVGGTCTINWGDGAVSVVPIVRNSAGGYGCGTTHRYQVRGKYTITVTATDVSAQPVSSDCTQIYVI
jgi:hypothetical protein